MITYHLLARRHFDHFTLSPDYADQRAKAQRHYIAHCHRLLRD